MFMLFQGVLGKSDLDALDTPPKSDLLGLHAVLADPKDDSERAA